MSNKEITDALLAGGGFVFPVTIALPEGGELKAHGLSIRDYLASVALPQAIQHELSIRAARIMPDDFRYDFVAETAYFMADAMLRIRAAQSPREAQDAHIQEFGK